MGVFGPRRCSAAAAQDALGERRLCVAVSPHPYVAPDALGSETCAEIEDLCRSAAAQEAEGATVAFATDEGFKDGCHWAGRTLDSCGV